MTKRLDGLRRKTSLDDMLDDMLLETSHNFVIGHSLIVLGGDSDGVDPDWDPFAILVVVLNSNLGLPIRS